MGTSADTGSTLDAPATDLDSETPPIARNRLATIAYVLGGVGLLAATAADSLAVLGRHTGFHLLGSIEMVQAAVVVLASSAMLVVTIVAGHASVHIVTDRLSPATKATLGRITAAISGLLFVAITIGSAWIAIELRGGHEQTELLHIPLAYLRGLWIVAAALIALCFFRHAVKRP